MLYADGREKVREYARAVGEANPLHLDLDAAPELPQYLTVIYHR